MIESTALILEATDYTRDGNLKGDVFRAICEANVVIDTIDGNRVVKCNPVPLPAAKEPVLIRSADVRAQAPDSSDG